VLKEDYGLEIFIEPGKAVVGHAGFLAATVVDCFVSDGENVTVLDSSVNHHPELFEAQLQLVKRYTYEDYRSQWLAEAQQRG
jgi:carboxynorspermidine decarboxylase